MGGDYLDALEDTMAKREVVVAAGQGCVKLVRKVKLGLGLERFFGTIDLEYCWLGGCQSQNECRTETNKLSWMNWK